jgi:protease-4
MKEKNLIVRFLAAIWRGLDGLRKALHLLVLLLLFGLVLLGLVGGSVAVPETAALVIDPQGELVEQLTGDPLDRLLGELQGDGVREVLVQDLVDSLEAAADDERIKAVVLRLDLLDAAGLPKLQAVVRAMERVREADKKIVAMGDSYDQWQYYLAAHADEVFLDDLGVVFIDGFGYYRTFIKSALDKLRVDLNVFRVGEYKSFVEPFIRDDMSEEDKQASGKWLQAMWAAYQRDVVAARELAPEALDDYANNLVAHLGSSGGSASRTALERGLVDGLLSRQAFRDYMIDLVGQIPGEDVEFSQIDYRTYLAAVRRPTLPGPQQANVGVIVAAGQIVDGEAEPGTIGGDSLAALVRQAAADDSIRSVVLRVDSPGGSMFASEVVLDELQALQAAGKPLVVSMGTLAASGGYYISMFADEIWASESTITGSIGVGALVPTFDRGLDALGVHVDGIATTRLGGQMRLDRPLGADARQFLDALIQDAYRIFVGKVAEARNLEFQRADELARGRVWIGADAQQLGLVDAIGDLPAAIESAARLAGLESGSYEVRNIEPDAGVAARIMRYWLGQAVANLSQIGLTSSRPAPEPWQLLRQMAERQIERLQALNDPRGLYYLCACEF